MSDSGSQSMVEERYCPSCDRSFASPLKHCPNDGTKLVTIANDPLLGRTLDDRFRIDEKLGSGGMGTVYSGSQTSIGRKIAIKVIHSRLSQRTEVVKRFLREAKLASRLNQANIVTVLDFGQSGDGLLYLVMELLEGRTLGQVMRDEGAVSVGRAANIAMQLCDALEAAHNLSIIHRDLKPSNVVILDKPAGRDYLKVLDFGLAKSLIEDSATTITHSDAILGTPAYISPEAVLGRDTDGRTDLYALGVILYQLVSGRLPFDASTANLMLTSHVNDPPRPLPDELDPAARDLIARLLAKDPAERPDTAAGVRALLEPLRSSRSIAATAGGESGSIAIADTVASDSDSVIATTAHTRSAPKRPTRLLFGGALLVAVAVAVASIATLVAVMMRGGGPDNTTAPLDAATEPTATTATIRAAPATAVDAGILPIDASLAATTDSVPPLIDAAAKTSPEEAGKARRSRATKTRRRDRRNADRRHDQGKKTDGNDSSNAPPPVWLKSRGGDGGVP